MNGAIKPEIFTKLNIPEHYATQMANRANMALSTNTKSNYQTVLNNIVRCEQTMECDLTFPWETPTKVLTFLAFLLFNRNVKSSTASCQLSGVRMAHLELGLDSPSLRPAIVKLLLLGTEHWENVSENLENKTMKSPVTTEMMETIKRNLFEVNWPLELKYLFWASITLCWNGSTRIHEILSRVQDNFDPQTTMLKNDIKLITKKVGKELNEIIEVKIKSPKEDRIGNGAVLQIFANNTFLCPVKALKHYVETRGGWDKFPTNKPFFVMQNRKCYTGRTFNAHLAQMTANITDCTGHKVRSHCLRAGVPSELARLGATQDEIKGVGRWSSDAWKRYCRLGVTHRMNMVERVCEGLSS